MAARAATNLFIVGAKRTPFGTFGGTLKGMSATDLAVHATRAAIADAGVSAEAVDNVVIGNVQQTDPQAAYLARHVALKSGCAISTPAHVVNRLCGSGFESLVSAAHSILLGEASVAVAGGTESMSQAPYHLPGSMRFGTVLGQPPQMTDTLWAGLTDSHVQSPMGMTAEKLAEMYNVTREDSDEYALASQARWAAAAANGVFDAEIAPVEVKGKRGKTTTFAIDEHPRPETTLEGLGKLPTVFKKDGVVTPGAASGICDGAASVVVASEEAANKHGLNPLARVVAWHVEGVDPTIMGIGPVPAIRGVLAKSGLSLDDIGLVEINEAFAPQYLACERELGLDRAITNASGGAIALGHPLGASGARIMSHLAHRVANLDVKYAIGSACIGGGQGIAVLIEKVI
ncbi:uncharacterized protein AMSG_12094 [Thecamonas trahens ATCC 50062]|uniref:Uncharacterized protein n=1 Tax=Thecamonas trahens ATCC 50062 TaxID=461836 RepID=A0A0L0DH39_THETB|nr:hypothetical protein AMSG_12094 [Thecamonas trahens ATCC 50062]KNC51659.1 hypothetical protein AMSG_12094 [Thecamonas trahens ATCC 50062]|eukprot:XP_013755895.1 hypothetical protein AMSG_12094 [Thecamonas trahens ATCC 50062]